MADVTGGPVVTNASPFAVPADLTDLKDHFGSQTYFSVANAAALPSSGNWVGRVLMAEDTDWLYQCTTLPGSWSLLATPPTAGTISFNAGWSLASGGVTLNGRYAVLSATFLKSSAIASGDTVGTIPAGWRPAAPTVGSGRMWGFASYNFAHVDVATTGVVSAFFTGANNETKLSVSMTYLRA